MRTAQVQMSEIYQPGRKKRNTQTHTSSPCAHNGSVVSLGLWGMYKRSEPMGRLHSVQKHMANVYLPLQFKEVEMFREHTM